MLAMGFAAVAQCPGVRPKFSWASDGSTIVFTDQTDAFVSERIWDFGDGDPAYEAIETHAYAFADDDTVRLTVTVDGCDFSVSARVVHPGENDACLSQLSSAFSTEQTGNNHMLFADSSQGDGSFLFYLWTFGDDSLQLTEDATHFYALPGAYDVSHSIGTVDSQFQTACVAGSAERVYVDGNTSTCDSSLFLNLVVETEGNLVYCNAEAALFNTGLVITSWEWDYGDGTYDSTGIPTAQHYYGGGGDMQVCVQVWTLDTTNGDTCFARSCISVSLPSVVGMGESPDPRMLRARPVPFNEGLWIEGEAVRTGARWRLLDVLGRETIAGAFSHDGAEHLEFQALPMGVYTLIVPLEQGVHSVRLFKQ